MQTIKILTSLHTMPNVKSVNTLFFENLLPALRKKIQVHMVWLVYQPKRLNLSLQNDPNITILDIHDYENAVEVIQKENPDIIFADASSGLIDYAISTAGKFLGIPVVSGFYSNLVIKKRSQTKLVKSYLTRFFESSIPTDTTQNQKQFMKRGRFFIYKYLFLLKTQKATKMSIFEILKDFFTLLKIYLTETKYLINSKFANTLHWLEGECMIEPLVKGGFQRSGLVVTGSPMYDGAFKKIRNWRSAVKKDGKIHVLLVTTSLYEHGFWTRKQRDTIVKKLVENISQNKHETSLTIKIHPSSEILSDYQSIIKPIDPSVPIYQTGNILEFLESADVVLSFASGNASAMIYALIARKPIIICNFYNLKDDLFLERGLALECKEPSEIISSIRKVVSSNPASAEKVEGFVREFFYKSDGQASERISDAIMMLVEK